jgi:hypothetical protein
MITTDPEVPAVPWNPRRSDDPFHRIQQQAENRARALGATEEQAAKVGRKAMILRRGLLDLKLEPDSELILRTVAGDFRRGD